MPLLLLALALWWIFGSPAKTVANWFWPSDAAPWETVDAFYYPHRADLAESVSKSGLESVEACRVWASNEAAMRHDPGIIRGDFECGIGKLEVMSGGLNVYRATAR